MPKYFDGDRPLPADVVKVPYNDISETTLQRLISEKGGNCVISVTLPGLGESSLGYIFMVRERPEGIELRDIKGILYFRNLTFANLALLIKHSSGVEYSPEVQQEFHRIRNEIGIDQ